RRAYQPFRQIHVSSHSMSGKKLLANTPAFASPFFAADHGKAEMLKCPKQIWSGKPETGLSSIAGQARL
ncbi:MAG: hypothetical protein KDJ74_09955, partial [Notoacmeibacter sp.]|nr:hypothetical protein [Notoacmeibacter sp.]